MFEFSLTPQLLASIAGIILSLVFSYVPGLNTKYAALSSQTKSAIMAGLLLIVSAAVYGGSCAGWFVSDIVCGKAGVFQLISTFVAALIANQSAFILSPFAPAVREVKADQINAGNLNGLE